jgi:hypothetical protein
MTDENTVNTEEEALSFINQHGFVTLFPLRKIVFQNLYQAAVGKNREEKFDKAWNWADNLAMKKRIHYGKFLHKQVTLISLDMLPYFYKLYKRKEFTDVPRRILEYLRKHGATSTTNLRKELDLSGRENKSKFAGAMGELQLGFAIAIVDRGPPPRMTYTWNLLERWMPDNVLQKAQALNDSVCRERIVTKLLENKSISKREDAKKFFGKGR